VALEVFVIVQLLLIVTTPAGILRIFALTIFLFLCLPQTLWSQELEDLKKGVVKIAARVEGKTEVGTGFIVRLDKDTAYIVTAAHVIEGDSRPQVAFYPLANVFLPAQIIGIEGGDPRGVALLVVKSGIPQEARAFSISTNAAVRGGEPVIVIGFPGQTGTPWMVAAGTIGGRKGSDITFSGEVAEGNSGGPLLQNGRVIGVIMQTGRMVSYAVPIASARFALEGWGVELTDSDEALLPKEISGKDGVAMVLVSSGDFLMGREKQQIYLDAFYVDKTLATTQIDWHEAEKYCRGRGKRLPSEAEWEKAGRLHLITVGKVDEWTADWYQEDYPEIRALRNPKGPSIGEPNDEEISRKEVWALSEAERRTEFFCSGSSGMSVCYNGECKEVPKCDSHQRIFEYENNLRDARQYIPARDMMKVVRKELDSRTGAFSRSESMVFRCAQDLK
jgi:hypothetical protein